MSDTGRRAWVLPALLGAAMPVLAASGPTISVSELARCVAIIAVDQRLACYDSLALSKIPPAHAPAAAAKAPAAGATPVSSASAGSDSAAAAVAPAAGAFGMGTHTPPTELSVQEVTARVVSTSSDRQGNVYVTLDNGQTWTYQDSSGGPPQAGAQMVIRRASLGSYLITTPFHHSFRATRTK